jgi:hypothetical protein
MDSNFKFVRYLESGKEQQYRYKNDAAEDHNLTDSETEVPGLRQVLSQKISDVDRRFNGTR